MINNKKEEREKKLKNSSFFTLLFNETAYLEAFSSIRQKGIFFFMLLFFNLLLYFNIKLTNQVWELSLLSEYLIVNISLGSAIILGSGENDKKDTWLLNISLSIMITIFLFLNYKVLEHGLSIFYGDKDASIIALIFIGIIGLINIAITTKKVMSRYNK